VLAIQDTSEINFTTTQQRDRGLGEIGKGVGRGLLLHAMLGSDAETGGILGLASGRIWTRHGRVATPQQRRPLPILWRLLTTHAIEDDAMAWRVAGWYRQRWVIEQFFRTLKQQGLRLEDSQLDSAERLIKLTAIAARAAWVIMQLVQARDGQSDQSAKIDFSPAKIETLHAWLPELEGKTALQKNPHPPNSLPWAAWIIAKLGGWDGYPKSKPPGPITFRHGPEYFRSIARGWKLRDV
jgi:hypothetical protein